MRDGALYAFKGLAGKIGPIGVHASMLVTLLGICMGLLGGFKGSILVPEGTDFLLAEGLVPATPLARYPSGGWPRAALQTLGSVGPLVYRAEVGIMLPQLPGSEQHVH